MMSATQNRPQPKTTLLVFLILCHLFSGASSAAARSAGACQRPPGRQVIRERTLRLLSCEHHENEQTNGDDRTDD